jgi:predicted transcriptional regulator
MSRIEYELFVDSFKTLCYIVAQWREMMKQTMTIRISDELREELQEISKAEGKPVSDLVRDSLQRYIALYRFRKLRNVVLPFAEAQGILTDEDVYKEIS